MRYKFSLVNLWTLDSRQTIISVINWNFFMVAPVLVVIFSNKMGISVHDSDGDGNVVLHSDYCYQYTYGTPRCWYSYHYLIWQVGLQLIHTAEVSVKSCGGQTCRAPSLCLKQETHSKLAWFQVNCGEYPVSQIMSSIAYWFEFECVLSICSITWCIY